MKVETEPIFWLQMSGEGEIPTRHKQGTNVSTVLVGRGGVKEKVRVFTVEFFLGHKKDLGNKLRVLK